MNYLRKTKITALNIVACAFCTLALTGFAPLQAQQANGTAMPVDGQDPSSVASGWQSEDTVHLIGFPDVKQKEKGSLSISPSALTFVSVQGSASVSRAEMVNVSIGDVSIESGGTAGKITRAIIPFGGGSALATVTHKNFSLLTIEFHDQHDALHGAVFLLPKDEALQAQQQLGTQALPRPTEPPHGHCDTNGGALPETITVAAITSQGVPVPAEYRMLIYEQLVRRLREEGRYSAVYRDGDDEPEAACSKYNLVLTLNAFKKGNAAVRASTGPVGFFVGATKLRFELQLQDMNGKTVFHKALQASQRGDTDSLNIADKIAKELTKQIKNGNVQAARS